MYLCDIHAFITISYISQPKSKSLAVISQDFVALTDVQELCEMIHEIC